MSAIKHLKEQLEQFEETITATLSSIQERISAIEASGRTTDSEIGKDKIEILAKIDEIGKDITAANVRTASEIKDDILQIKDVVIKNLQTDNKTLRKRLSKLEKRTIENERKLNEMDQHSRKVNLEIEGIPDSIEQKDLKNFAVEVFKHAGITPVSNEDIEVIHRLRNKKTPHTTILKAKRDFIDRIYEKKKIIQGVAKRNMGLTNTILYINSNLCPAYKAIAYNCRKLKKSGLILDTWCANGQVKIKFSDNNVEKISHEYDLYELFSDFADFSFDTSCYSNFCSDDSSVDET